MKVAVIGSRNAEVEDLSSYLPSSCTEIVSGGAKGIDQCAAKYARKNGLQLTEFLPQYERFGRVAPIVRNKQIVDYADLVLAFWDGASRGTYWVIRYCEENGKPCTVVRI